MERQKIPKNASIILYDHSLERWVINHMVKENVHPRELFITSIKDFIVIIYLTSSTFLIFSLIETCLDSKDFNEVYMRIIWLTSALIFHYIYLYYRLKTLKVKVLKEKVRQKVKEMIENGDDFPPVKLMVFPPISNN